jgi:hypothetical protein
MARKESKYNYIYKITCLKNEKYYIGMHSTNNLEDGYMGGGIRIKNSVKKHGKDAHRKEILEFFESRELLIEAEKKAITSDMITDVNCMNIMSGGTGGYISESHYQITSKIGGEIHANRMKNDLEYREKTITIATDNIRHAWNNGKFNNSKRFSGKQHSEETKQKMSESLKGMGIGETNSQYGTCWITRNNVNKKIKKEDLDSFIQDGWVKGRI